MADPVHVENNPDGTSRVLMPDDDALQRTIPPDIDADPGNNINSLFAAQIAIHDIVAGLRIHISDYERVVERKPAGPVREFTLERVTFDYPKSEDEIQPFAACIMETGDQVFDEDHIAGPIVTDYSDTMSLVRLSHTQCALTLVAWFGHKEERRAFRTALAREMLKEPKHTRSDRLVVVEQYFGLQVRLRLMRMRFPESGDAAQANHWEIQAMFEASVPEAMLVPRKAKVRVEARVHTSVKGSP